jgi:phospholipid transport system substrate-binding protein
VTASPSPRLGRRGALTALLAAAPACAWAQAADPAAPIRVLNDALLRAMHAGRAVPFADRVKLLAPAVSGAFDLPQILRASVGLRWPAMPPAQQTALLEVFTRYTVASYVANFDNFSGERFDILPETRAVASDRVVQTRIVPKSGDPARIDYQMRQTPAGWRAVDVLLDGSISRVAVQRSDFRALLSGGDAERLIASLRNKVAGLESGAKL